VQHILRDLAVILVILTRLLYSVSSDKITVMTPDHLDLTHIISNLLVHTYITSALYTICVRSMRVTEQTYVGVWSLSSLLSTDKDTAIMEYLGLMLVQTLRTVHTVRPSELQRS